MKKSFLHTQWLMVAVVCLLPCVVTAQTRKTQVKEQTFTKWFPNVELSDDVTLKTNIYYDADDNEVRHGAASVKHSRNLNYNGVVGKLTYTASGNYVDGVLNGAVNISMLESFSRPKSVSFTTILVANYANGVPTGTWKIEEIATMGAQKETYSLVITYGADGVIRTLKSSNGNRDVVFNADSTFSGTYKGEKYIHNILVSKFRRINGNHTELDEDAKKILNAYNNGEITKDDLINYGYLMMSAGNDLSDDLYASSDSYLDDIGLGIFKNKYRYRELCPEVYYIPRELARVKLTPTTKIFDILQQPDYQKKNIRSWEDVIEYDISNNYVEDLAHYGRYYFDNSTRDSVLQYINTIITNIEYREQLLSVLREKKDSVNTLSEQYSYLRDEQQTFQKVYDAVRWYETPDTTTIKNTIQIADVVLDICHTTTKFYTDVTTYLQKVKEVSPQMYQFYSEKFAAYNDTCKNCTTLSNFTNYHSRIQSYRTEFDAFRDVISLLQTMGDNQTAIEAYSKNKVVADVVKLYKQVEKNDAPEMNNDVFVMQKNVANFVNQQKQFIDIIHSRITIVENDAKIAQLAGKTYADVLKAYDAVRKQQDISVSLPLSGSCSRLQDILTMQADCESFIAERAKIYNLDIEIKEAGKDYKNISKVYTTYIKGADMAWSKDVSIEKLRSIQDTQHIFLKSLQSANVSEKDTAIKNTKDKGIDNILKIIN